MAYIREHQLVAVARTVGRLRLQATRKLPTSDLFPNMAGLYAASRDHKQENWGARNIIIEFLNLCAHSAGQTGDTELFHAFITTCHDHWWSHAKLVTLFDHAAGRKMSNLITLVLGVNTELLPASNVIRLLPRNVETPDLTAVVDLLKKDIADFPALHELALRCDMAIACRVNVYEEQKERPFSPGAPPPRLVYRRKSLAMSQLRSGD